MKLLIIGLDGLRVDVALPGATAADPAFAQPDEDREPTGEVLAPTLQRLLDQGGRLVPVWMTPPTDSGPGWASLLTGTTHEEHGVWGNDFAGHRLSRCPDVLSQVWSADPRARTFAAAGWWPLVDPDGPGPVIHQRLDQQRAGQHVVLRATDTSERARSADRQVVSEAARVLGHDGPDASFVYLERADEAGHDHGAASQEYRDAVGEVDEQVRHLVETVSQRHEQLGERWLVAVTTDHGHKPEGGHGEDEVEVRRSFLLLHEVGADLGALDLPTALRSEQVTPLLLSLLGVSPGARVADPGPTSGRCSLRVLDPAAGPAGAVVDAAAVVVDCDGLLVDSEGAWLDLVREVLDERGLHAVPAADLRGLSAADTARRVRALDPTVDADLLARHLDTRYSAALRAGVPRMPGALELLGALHGVVPLAVASNGTRADVTALLRDAELLDLLEVVVAVEDVARPKPAPDPYLLAASRLGVDPASCVALEDSAAGATAARAAGMTVVGVNADPRVVLPSHLRVTGLDLVGLQQRGSR